jgi:hypothetical protein
VYYNPEDAPLKDQKIVMEAISVCKSHKIKIIWSRTLWPTYEVKGFKESQMTDPNYYKVFISKVRTEAQSLGAEYTAVDTEPYGYFPFQKMFGNVLGKERFEAMQKAVDNATQKEGKFDFVLPVGGALKNLMYDAVIGLGKIKIAEHTYFDIPAKIHDNRRPYDVLGAYISIRKTNKAVPEAPYFTVQEILERQDLWRDRTGLMLYPKEDEIEAIADQLSQIKTIVPRE